MKIFNLKSLKSTTLKWTPGSTTWPIYSILEHNMNFPSKSKTVTFSDFLMLAIRYNFSKTFSNFRSVDFGPKNDPFLPTGDNMGFTSKPKTVTLNHFLMPVVGYNFRKAHWTDLERSSKIKILSSKMSYLPYFKQNNFSQNFSQQTKTVTLTHFLMPFIRNNFRKKSTKQI